MERDVKVHKGWDLCLYGGSGGGGGGSGGGGIDGREGSDGLVLLMVVVGIVVLVMVVRVVCVGVVRVVRVLCIGVLEVYCVETVDILVLGTIFMVEVVKGVELVVWCVVGRVVRLVLQFVNRRGYFLRCFSLKLVEINGLSVVGFLFGMVIWADCFIFLERGFLDKMVDADALLDVVVFEAIEVETVDVVQVWFFVFFRGGCLGDIMGVGVVIEAMVGVVVLVWWRCSLE